MAAEAFVARFETAKKKAAAKTKARGWKTTLKKRTPDELKKAKEKSRCSVCGELGHWYGDPECRGKGSSSSPGATGSTSKGSGKGFGKRSTYECDDGSQLRLDSCSGCGVGDATARRTRTTART